MFDVLEGENVQFWEALIWDDMIVEELKTSKLTPVLEFSWNFGLVCKLPCGSLSPVVFSRRSQLRELSSFLAFKYG